MFETGEQSCITDKDVLQEKTGKITAVPGVADCETTEHVGIGCGVRTAV